MLILFADKFGKAGPASLKGMFVPTFSAVSKNKNKIFFEIFAIFYNFFLKL